MSGSLGRLTVACVVAAATIGLVAACGGSESASVAPAKGTPGSPDEQLAAADAGVMADSGEVPQTDPGQPAPVSITALDTSPVVSDPSAQADEFVRVTAGYVGLEYADALSQLHQLANSLGVGDREALAFRGRDGGVCFAIGTNAGCTDEQKLAKSGASVGVGGGDKNGPPAFSALVTDSVASIELVVDGSSIDAAIANNVGYADLPRDAEDVRWVIVKDDGTRTRGSVSLRPPPTPEVP